MKKLDKKKFLFDFIRKYKIAVIATVNQDGKPEAAVLEFGETENLELIFDTFSESRKCKNIQNNRNIAFVIGWDEDITVQYEGEAFELTHTNELEKYKQAFFKKNPEAKRWERRKGIVYFKVIPKWIRYSDLRVHLWKIFEVEF